MITRTVQIQLVVFLALTLVGTAVAGIRYAGLGRALVGGTYVVHADFADAGGIFTGAEVTYRGVAVGRVDRLRPTRSGVDVALTLDDGTRVPADTLAVVANRSAIGEQYVDLQPRRREGPYLRDGTRIARAGTRTPLPTTTLLLDLDRLASSVPKKDLVTVLDELGTAFAGTGPDLSRLVDAGNSLVETADANLAQTVDLIDRGGTVLDTQRDSGSAIRSFAGDLADLSDTLVRADPDVREVLASGVLTAEQVQGLVDENAGDVPVLLANLASTGQLVRVRLRGVQQALILYPYVVRGGYTVVARDPGSSHYTAHFGLQLATSPGACRKGYEGTRRRSPQDLGRTPLNTDARCTDRTTTERGAENAPGAGAGEPRTGSEPPRSGAARSGAARSGVRPAAYDPSTGVVRLPGGEPARIGSLGGEQRVFGKESWKWLLIGPMTR